MPSNALGPLLAGGRFLLAKTGERLGNRQTEKSICLHDHQRPGLRRTKRNIADRKDSITVLIEPTIAFFYSAHKRWGTLFFVCDGASQSRYRQGGLGTLLEADMINLASDNVVGASREILDAIAAANAAPEASYGADRFSRDAEARLGQIFERDVKVFLVATGTAANALALSAFTPPWGAVFCHEESHIADDECGAPEMYTAGAKLIGIRGEAGKFSTHDLEHALKRFPRGVTKAVQPSLVSLSQVTECGTLYTLDEIKALAGVAKRYDIAVHMDGARFANALLSLGCSPAEMTWKSGVDVLSFGATKNGALACEAVIFFDPKHAKDFDFRRKRSGHTLSKGRLFGAQLLAYLENDLWIANARHANAMAKNLSEGFAKIKGFKLPWKTEANEVFAIMPKRVSDALSEAKIFAAPWYKESISLPHDEQIKEDESFLRFVTSYATKPEEIETVLKTARAA